MPNSPAIIMGSTFDDINAARAQAQVLQNQGMKVRIFGPARRARIQGVGADAVQWPAGAATDRYLVLATDSTIETPPPPPPAAQQ